MRQDNSFKPYKCLLYKNNFDGIIDGKLAPPVEVSIDPVNACNYKCEFCNAWRVLDGGIIPKNQMMHMLEDLAAWGTEAVCFAGGGEPTVYPYLNESILKCKEVGLESAIITNGFNVRAELMQTMVDNMKWIGISVDAAKKETYNDIKQTNGFDTVIGNIKEAVWYRAKTGSKVGITFKFLIYHKNYKEIYDACKLAKDIGCDSFHMRPVDYLGYQNKEENLDVKLINELVTKAMELDDDNFEVIPFFYNFDDNLKHKITFDKCEISPLIGLVMPSGWWVCLDRRGYPGLKICEVDDIRKFWGSKKHLDILKSIHPKTDCGKCTLAKYYPYFDSYRKDEFYWKFV